MVISTIVCLVILSESHMVIRSLQYLEKYEGGSTYLTQSESRDRRSCIWPSFICSQWKMWIIESAIISNWFQAGDMKVQVRSHQIMSGKNVAGAVYTCAEGVDICARQISASECMMRAAWPYVYRFTPRDAYGMAFGYTICPRTFMGIWIVWTLICPNGEYVLSGRAPIHVVCVRCCMPDKCDMYRPQKCFTTAKEQYIVGIIRCASWVP